MLGHLFRREMGDKPFLSIEVDEHDSKVAVVTRIEAFVSSLKGICSATDETKPMREYLASMPLRILSFSLGRIDGSGSPRCFRMLHAAGCGSEGPLSTFSSSSTLLRQTVDSHLPAFAGANGRYRCTKAAVHAPGVSGIVSLASMYENTATILGMLEPPSQLPRLALVFDGNTGNRDALRLSSFLRRIRVSAPAASSVLELTPNRR